MESLALGAPPLAVPLAMPSKLALPTMDPAIVEAVCVPCPPLSRADRKNILLALLSRGPFSASNPFE